MSQTVRAFVAVELPPHVGDTLSGLVRFLDAERVRGLRTVAPDAVHLTLKYLGDVQESQTAAIEAALLDAAAGRPALVLKLDQAGVFPQRGAPRVLWVGLAGDTDGLAALQTRVEEALEALGFPREGRPFHPHLTIGRMRERTTAADRVHARQALLSAPFEPGQTLPVDALSLMQSILRPAGARYRRLASIPLGPSAATED